jgi:nucleoside-diphosphate-sugar epimerase
MQYIVTGATGFIGAHLVRELIKNRENTVLALVRTHNSLWRLEECLVYENLHLIEVDFLDYVSLVDALKGYHPKTLFYVLWEGVQNTYRNDCIQTKNREILSNLLRLAKELEIETIVGLGSQAEYGIKHHPVQEEDSLQPTTLYGMEKVNAYKNMKEFCKAYTIKYRWLRLFSSYGPFDHPTWLIPYVITHLLQNKEILLTEGSQQWDYLYVEDVAKALVTAVDMKESGVFNLGSGESSSIRTIVSEIYKKLRPELRPSFGSLPFRQDQHMLLQADMSKFFSKSSWRPSISLEEGLDRTIHHYKSVSEMLLPSF